MRLTAVILALSLAHTAYGEGYVNRLLYSSGAYQPAPRVTIVVPSATYGGYPAYGYQPYGYPQPLPYGYAPAYPAIRPYQIPLQHYSSPPARRTR